MRAKILIAAMAVLAFVLGTMASGIYSATSRAFNPVDEKVNSPAETVKSTAQTHLVQPKTVYVSDTPAASRVYQSRQSPKKRSLDREALIVGGSAGAGAAIGTVAGVEKAQALERFPAESPDWFTTLRRGTDDFQPDFGLAGCGL